MQQGRLFTWLSFGSAQPSKVAQFSVGANTVDGPQAVDGAAGTGASDERESGLKSGLEPRFDPPNESESNSDPSPRLNLINRLKQSRPSVHCSDLP